MSKRGLLSGAAETALSQEHPGNLSVCMCVCTDARILEAENRSDYINFFIATLARSYDTRHLDFPITTLGRRSLIPLKKPLRCDNTYR